MFAISHTSVENYLMEILPLLHKLLSPTINIPPYEIRKKTNFSLEDGYTYSMIVDGMEHEVYSCSTRLVRDTVYSGKKSFPSFTQLIGVNQEGCIWFISGSYPGSNIDINLSQYYENRICDVLEKDEMIAADQGFRGLEDLKIFTHIAKAKTTAEKEFNKHFKHYRSVVENSIAQIRMWKICSYRFYTKLEPNLSKALLEHTFIVEIVAGLVNRFVMPIRDKKINTLSEF